MSYRSKKTMIEVEDFNSDYSQRSLIKNLSFKLNKGDKICIIGKNGRGKSTLLKLL